MATLDSETATRNYKLWLSMLDVSYRLARAGVEYRYPPEEVDGRLREIYAYNSRLHWEGLIVMLTRLDEIERRATKRTD